MNQPAPEGRKITVGDPASPSGAGSEDGAGPAPVEADAAPGAVPPDAGSELDALTAERDEYLDALQRLKAEFENYRKRTARERGTAAAGATREIGARLLPVMDNLERAVQALGAYGPEAVSGVEMVRGQLAAVLADAGIEAVPAGPGDAFDPMVHEAVAQQPTADYPEGAVTEIVQKGYRDAEGVVRPARVVVAAAPGGSE